MLNFRLTVIGNCRFGLGDTLVPLLNAGLISRDIYNLLWQSHLADEILTMRSRVEASGSKRDLKRGVGGIVDIEFLVQMYRLEV